ncbi:MAG: hypothetical protein HY776_05640, partial [Actinobacteria bacterium]|nr:hypothetical protein [Actinomycetota bacterium]
KIAYNYKAHLVIPYMWLNPGSESFYMVKDSPFERAIKDFIIDVSDQPFESNLN